MPPTERSFGKHVTLRWARYFGALLTANKTNPTNIARKLQLPTSRISQWQHAKRLIKPQTAFELGEELHDTLGWETSGPEILYACGYLAELLDFLKHLSVDRANGGHKIAVAYYCWLPAQFIFFEEELSDDLDSHYSRRPELTPYETEMYRYIAEQVGRESGHPAGYLSESFSERLGRIAEIGNELRAVSRDIILHAWKNVNRAHLEPSWEIFEDDPEGDVVEHVIKVSLPGNIAIIESIAELALRLRVHPPTFVAPKLWRMLSEWAHHTDYSTFSSLRGLIPRVFSVANFDERPPGLW